MANTFFVAPTKNFIQKTLNGAITNAATSITLNNTTNMQTPGYIVVDRVDSSGTVLASSVRETIYYTGISGSQLTGCVRSTDGEGGAGLPHGDGAIVECTFTEGMWNSLVTIVANGFDGNGLLNPLVSPVSISIGRFTQFDVSSVASIAQLNIKTIISASGASVVGFGGVGGLNAVFQVPNSLASLNNVGGLVIVPTNYTGTFINLIAQTPASAASIYITIKKNISTVYGVIGMLATATFASSASISSAALVPGDQLTIDVGSGTTNPGIHGGADITVLLRAT